MTSTPPPFDELVSAYLDGEATADEVARVESSPELMAEVRRLEAITQRVASTDQIPPPPAGQREVHLAAALAAFDTSLGTTAGPSAAARPELPEPTIVHTPDESSNVASLEQRRNRRTLFSGRALGIAAAVALFFLGAAALFSFNGSTSNPFETADVVTDAVDSASDAASDSAESVTESDMATQATEATSGDGVLADATMDRAGAMDDEDAMADDEAMEDETTQSKGAADVEEAIEEEESAPAADTASDTAPSSAARAPSESALFESDSGDSAMADDGGVGADFFLASSIDPSIGEPYWLGELSLREVPQALDQRTSRVTPPLRTNCQLESPELDGNAEPTLLGLVTVDGVHVEIHRLPGTDAALLLDATTCVVLDEVVVPR